MTWNFRVVKTVYNAGTPNEEARLSIHEVYYDKDGNATGVTVDAVAITVDADEDDWSIEEAFAAQMKALTLPVLNFEDFDNVNDIEVEVEKAYPSDEVRKILGLYSDDK